MFKALLLDLCIMIAFLFSLSQLYKNNELLPQKKRKGKIFAGIILGIAGCLMITSAINMHNILIDFKLRPLPILISSVYGTPLTCIISGTIISIFSLINKGINIDSVVYSTSLIIYTLGCCFLIKDNFPKKAKWFFLSFYSIVVTALCNIIIINDVFRYVLNTLIYFTLFLLCSLITYKICSHIVKTKKLLMQLEKEATEDFLTGLKNTRSFNLHYKKLQQKSYKNSEHFSMLAIDIDFFKAVNDTYGHDAGNIVLKETSLLMKNICKSPNSIYRIGGEEFVIILENCPLKDALSLAEKIRSSMECHKFRVSNSSSIRITVSIGTASYPQTSTDISNLLKQADTSLYKAKNSGRNKVCCDVAIQPSGHSIN